MRPLLTIVLAVMLAGCAQTRQYTPPVDPHTLTDAQLVHYIAAAPLVTYEEACRAFVVASEGADQFDEHTQRVAFLADKGIVRPAWNIAPDQVLDMGTLAYMMAQTCDLPPSIDSLLLGSWGLGDRRYAHRNVIERGMLDYSPHYKLVTGGEMVMALARTDAYLEKHGRYDLGEEIDSPADAPTGAP